MATEPKSETAERAYAAGRRSLAVRLVAELLIDLDPSDRGLARLAKERAETVAALREVCADYGDNDWPDTLSLADVVENHVARHLHHKGVPVRSTDGFENEFSDHVGLARRCLTAVPDGYTEAELDDIGRRARHWVMKAFRDWSATQEKPL